MSEKNKNKDKYWEGLSPGKKKIWSKKCEHSTIKR
jgi:hypothetical protein